MAKLESKMNQFIFFPLTMEFFLHLWYMPKNNEIRITGVPEQIKSDLKNIAKNQGVNLGQLLKPKLREIRDSYPEHMRINLQK